MLGDLLLDDLCIAGSEWGYVIRGREREFEALEESGYLDLDPTGSIYRLTDFGAECCENKQAGWEEDCQNWRWHEPHWLSKRAYARHRRCSESAVRAACKGRLAFAVENGLIDRDLADALWVCTKRPVKKLPLDRREVSEFYYRINHERPRDPFRDGRASSAFKF